MGVRAAAGRGIAMTSGVSARTRPVGWMSFAASGELRATSTHSEESGIQASAGGFRPAWVCSRALATVAACAACTATTAQRPSTWRCSLLKNAATRWTTGSISLETATCAVLVWPAQVGLALMVLFPRATRTPAAITRARRVSNTVLSLRLRPGRYRPSAPVRPVVKQNPSLHETRRPGTTPAGALARPHQTSRIRERCGDDRKRCGDDCSRRSSRMRSLARFAREVLALRKRVRRERGMRAPRRPGQTGTMAGIVVVDDPSDPRLADYARLTDVRLRSALEPAHGLFVAEGDKVIRRAVAAGYQVRSMLVTQDKLAGLTDVAGACPGPVYLVSDEAAEQVTGYRVHRGALASMARRALPTVTGLLSGGPLAGHGPAGRVAGPAPAGTAHQAHAGQPGWPRRIVILEDLVDHGNVGGIFRCAAALGVDAVILSPRCADPLYRRAVKVSMGA